MKVLLRKSCFLVHKLGFRWALIFIPSKPLPTELTQHCTVFVLKETKQCGLYFNIPSRMYSIVPGLKIIGDGNPENNFEL
jgi:hypothetical protein